MLIVQYMVFYLCHKSAGNNTPYLHSVIQDNKNFVIVIFSGVLKEAHNNSLCLQLHRHESDIKAEVLSFPLRRQAALCFSPPLSTMTAHLGPGRLFLHHIAAFVCSWLQYYPPPVEGPSTPLPLSRPPSLSSDYGGVNEVGPNIAENIASRGEVFPYAWA